MGLQLHLIFPSIHDQTLQPGVYHTFVRLKFRSREDYANSDFLWFYSVSGTCREFTLGPELLFHIRSGASFTDHPVITSSIESDVNINVGRAIAQAVSRWLPTAAARV
jgi:hypothetical protein